MKFYHYPQNNSGGTFDFDAKAGITHHVVIEADNVADADNRAERIGIYFDGCESKRDCDCCGDRWMRADGNGDETPKVYHLPADSYLAVAWMDDGKEIAVHYASGPIAWHGVTQI